MNVSWRYWQGWVAATVVSWAIWLAVLLTNDNHPTQTLWPLWVTVPWGAVLLANRSRGGR